MPLSASRRFATSAFVAWSSSPPAAKCRRISSFYESRRNAEAAVVSALSKEDFDSWWNFVRDQGCEYMMMAFFDKNAIAFLIAD
jgi:hypothetical protein